MPNENSQISETFKKSLKAWGGTGAQICNKEEYLLDEISPLKLFSEQYSPPRIRARGDEWSKIIPILRMFTNAYLIQELDRIFDGPGDIIYAIDTMDSPIEVLFFTAFILVARENNVRVECEWKHPTSNFESHKDLSAGVSHLMVLIIPQRLVGDYRVDFLIRATGTAIRRAEGFKKMGFSEHRIEKSMIVECDGHDFHEKTKKQAQRDKERDRILQGLGHPVYRYTGSELFKDPFRCAVEVFLHLTGNEFVSDLKEMAKPIQK